MSSAPLTATPLEGASAGGHLGRRRPPGRRWVLAGMAALLVAAGVALGLTDLFSPKATSSGTTSAAPTSTATVTERPLSAQTQVDATLGYAGSYAVVNQASGTITSLPQVGQVISQGQVLYQVSGKPVVLLYGSTPAYRTLSQDMTGPDVQELNADLVALGYASSAELSPTSDSFTAATASALESLQAALGEPPTGTLSLGQAVFLPGAARITAVQATLGAQAPPGQTTLEATSTTRVVTVDLDASQQSEVAVGDHVTITLPDGQTTPGVVSSVGTVATSSSSSSSPGSSSSGSPGSGSGTPTITVLVTPSDPAATASLDEAPVEVTITTASVPHALVVPIDALLARPGGGYAVEVVGKGSHRHLVAVSLGLFDDADGLVQVSGSRLSAGQEVVVPAL